MTIDELFAAFGSNFARDLSALAARVKAVPINAVPPSISGVLRVGETLLAGGDIWTGHPTVFSYRWFRDNMVVVGAITKTYTPSADDVGHMLTVTEAAYNAAGDRSSATSAAVGPVLPAVVPESLDGTTVDNIGPAIVDSHGDVWGLIDPGAPNTFQIIVNGIADGPSVQVAKLVYRNHTLWQMNRAGNWFWKRQKSDAWVFNGTIDPYGNVQPPPPPPPMPPPSGVQARSVNAFLNSVGINAHLDQNAETVDQLASWLNYLGVRQCRTGGSVQQHLDLFHKTAINGRPGARAIELIDGPHADSSLPARLADARILAASGALLAIEGPNEPNNWRVNYKGHQDTPTDWTGCDLLQRDLNAMVRDDPVLRAYPVWDQSQAGAEPTNLGLQFIEGKADFANIHCGIAAPVDNGEWNTHSRPGNLAGLKGQYGLTWLHHFPGYSNAQLMTLPAVITESYGGAEKGGTEEARASLAIMGWLDAFASNFALCFYYQVKDEFKHLSGFYNEAGQLKQSAVIVHNFFAILEDTADGPLGKLNYSISGQTALEHKLLLQKSNGEFELVLWRESFTSSVGRTVNLGATYSTVKVYDPFVGVAPIQSLVSVSAVTVTLSDHPLIIEIA